MPKHTQAFTLVELLVVVLIIGVLSAIALPMYQGAVDKSHWSTMLPGAKAIKDAEEAIKMSNGAYTDEMANLDVTMNNSDLTFALVTPNNTADPNVIRVTNSKLANVRLASYLDQSPMFAGQLHCEAKTGDERANKLCEKLLMGQDLTSADGYTAYLLDQEIDKATCGDASRVWSNKQTKCYKTNEERCKANGMDSCTFSGNGTEENRLVVEEGGNCYGGWTCNYLQVNEGGECTVRNYGGNQYVSGCQNSIFNSGSKCTSLATPGGDGCTGKFYGATCEGNASTCSGEFHDNSICIAGGAHACMGTFDSGSVCNGDHGYSCHGSTFKAGSKCIANQYGTCGHVYGDVTYDGGCCEGAYCPSNAPKC
ncbi:MAG: prepilin-type N-terminal cleavage/methylation domain-containing protein [Elusimicrobiaceae bacterium]|nr:prepilin-type N-terminal cleavage/methylation domain-containing protein [Elusimicrobiaceae bacterium]